MSPGCAGRRVKFLLPRRGLAPGDSGQLPQGHVASFYPAQTPAGTQPAEAGEQEPVAGQGTLEEGEAQLERGRGRLTRQVSALAGLGPARPAGALSWGACGRCVRGSDGAEGCPAPNPFWDVNLTVLITVRSAVPNSAPHSRTLLAEMQTIAALDREARGKRILEFTL